jgi:hypothetical protein
MTQVLRAYAHGAALIVSCALVACSPPASYDVILRAGTIYDGSGADPYVADVGIDDDVIAAIGSLGDARAALEIDAAGLAVAPGFINMLSWANESLIHDGRSQSDIRQGVTLEVMGEGNSMGPLNAAMKQELIDRQSGIRYAIEWDTLGSSISRIAVFRRTSHHSSARRRRASMLSAMRTVRRPQRNSGKCSRSYVTRCGKARWASPRR